MFFKELIASVVAGRGARHLVINDRVTSPEPALSYHHCCASRAAGSGSIPSGTVSPEQCPGRFDLPLIGEIARHAFSLEIAGVHVDLAEVPHIDYSENAARQSLWGCRKIQKSL